MIPDPNPFPDDADRATIWQMLMSRDIDAFVAADWSMTEPDFVREGFFGLDAGHSANPERWRMRFPDLASYRDEWLRQAAATAQTAYAEPLRAGILRATRLTQIDIDGDHAVAHKTFDGSIARQDGGADRLNWQTLYICARHNGAWKIASFIGYLPFPMG